MSVESASLSLPKLSPFHSDRAKMRSAIREWMKDHALTLPMACRALNVHRSYLRDLLTEDIPAKPERLPRLGYRTSTFTFIHEGIVHTNSWTGDDTEEAFDLIRQFHLDHGTTDAYMSLDNPYGVTIAEFELRRGKIHRDRRPGMEAAN